MTLNNPYKLQNAKLREVRFDVSEAAFSRLYATCPKRGMMDSILSNLFHKFVTEIERTIPLPQQTTEFSPNENQIALMLSRTSFSTQL